MTDRARAAVALLAVALAVAACGEPAAVPEPGAPGGSLPQFLMHSAPSGPGATIDVPTPPPPVAWGGDGETLAVLTGGSSSCPDGPADVTVVGAQELRIDVGPLFPGRDPCTADMALRTTEVDLPGEISADEPVTVHLQYDRGEEKTVVLPPAGE